jgi:hypothetical protein
LPKAGRFLFIAGVFPPLQLRKLSDRKLPVEPAFMGSAVKLRCDNCHHEIADHRGAQEILPWALR